MNEYVQAGGTAPGNDEMKSDLLAVLPTDLREALLWKASDEGPFYKFRDMVLTQNAKILMNRRRLPIHAVQEENEEDNEDVKPEGINSMEDLLMAIGYPALDSPWPADSGPQERWPCSHSLGPGASGA